MKKNILVLFVIIIVFCACNQVDNKEKPNLNVSLSGKVIDASGKRIVLEQMFPNSVIKIDSAIIDNDFSFIINTNIESLGFYLLRIDKENVVYLVLKPNDKINVEGTYGKFAETYNIKGSVDCEIARELNLHLIESAKKLEELNKIYDAALQNTPSSIEQVLKDLDVRAMDLYDADKSFLIEFIHKYQTSPVIFLALFQHLGGTRILTPERDMEVYEFCLEKLKELYPKLEQTTSLEQQLNDYKQKYITKGVSVIVGDEAPEISLPSPDGKIYNLTDFRGKYVLLDFWASWCKPCRSESQNLVNAYNKYKDKNFTVFQVSLDKDKNEWEKAIASDHLNWIHVSDLKFWDCVPAKIYGVQSIPASFLLDPNGIVIATNLRGKSLDEKLSEILK